MLRKISSLSIAILAAVNAFAADVWEGSVATAFTAGKGTVAEPYQISNGAELALFAQKVSGGDTTLSAVLTDDIYLNEGSENYKEWGVQAPQNSWTPIGRYNHKFNGSFDGKGHKVYGVFIDIDGLADGYQGVGFFGTIGDSAKVKNLGLMQSFVSVKHSINASSNINPHVGILAGLVYGSYMNNIMAQGVVKADVSNETTALHYSEIGCVSGYAGKRFALVGAVADCQIESAFEKKSTGESAHSVGGLIGKIGGTTFVKDVYSISSVKNTSTLANASEYSGGIVGHHANATDTLYNAYYNINTIGTEDVPLNALGISNGKTSNVASKTTSKMKSEDFANLLGPAFTYTASQNNGYPQLVIFEGAAAFDGGNGTESSPYLIGSAKALRAMSGLVNGMHAEYGNKHYKMTADVELNEDSETYKSWETTPPEFSWFQIGREYHRADTVNVDCGATDAYACTKNVFTGVFDGAHHRIKGIYLNDTTNQSQGGLFYVIDHATIKNTGIVNSFISVKGRAAGITGVAGYSKIDSCYNEAEIRSISQDNGGIVGVSNHSEISNSYNKGNIKVTKLTRSAWSSAGIVGEMFRESKVSNSWNSGNVIGVQSTAGGIAGYCDSSTIENVYNRGSVTSDSVTGGVVGVLRISSKLTGGYNTGAVSSKVAAKRGGVIGQMVERSSPKVRNIVSDSYYNSQTIGSTNAPTAAIGTSAGTVTNTSALPTATMTTGRFAIMLGSAYKQDDAVNDGYPTFLAEGETYGVKDIFAGGDGSENNPFQIATATQLRNMEYLVNKKNKEYGASHYKLVADITLNENTSAYTTWATTAPANTWTPMGTDSTVSFKGIFDGANYSISGVYSNAKFSGLFGVIDAGAVVKNLTIKESLVKTTSASGRVGMLAGYNKGRIHNVHNKGNVNANMTTTSTVIGGGVIGFNEGGNIDSCSNAGSVDILGNSKGNRVITGGVIGKDLRGTLDGLVNTGLVTGRSVSNNSVIGKAITGGVVGYSAYTLITNAKNTGKVVSKANDSGVKAQAWVRIGGILGADSLSSTIKWCVNTGNIEGTVSSLFDTDHSVVNGGGIVGDQLEGKSYIGYCRNEGNITANASYANARSEIGGILGYNRGDVTIEYCYTKGILSATSSATSNPKSVMNQVGGIVANLRATSIVKGCFSYMNIKSSLTGTTKTGYVAGIVGNNAGPIVGSYFDKTVAGISTVAGNNTGTLTKALALATEEMQTNEFAWKLNTLGGDSTNTGAFTRYNSYPEFSDATHLPIYRVIFDDAVDINNIYTSYSGYVKAPANPEPAPGEMFVGWTDGDMYMLQSRQVIDHDMTLYALFTLLTEPIYSITFIDGSDVYVKATETTGKLKTLPVAKNIPMGYHFDGWFDNETDALVTTETVFTGVATAVARFSANLYKITFFDFDGTEISSREESYGQMPKIPAAPHRDATSEFTYEFAGWDRDVTLVAGEASYVAVYDSAMVVASSSSTVPPSSSSVESSSSVVPSSSSEVESSSSAESSSSVKPQSSSSSVKSSSSSAKSSSSSAKSSSSSAKSSSSSAKSSSSSAKSSSSKAKSSSSSAKSSSSKAKSSSSSKDNSAIVAVRQAPTFSVAVAGRNIQIAGAQVGKAYTLLDLQGCVLKNGTVDSGNFNLNVPGAGTFLVRIGSQARAVTIK